MATIKIRCSLGNIRRVEQDIAPPMDKAITIPMTVETVDGAREIVVYVSTPYWPRIVAETSHGELEAITREIVRRIEAGDGR